MPPARRSNSAKQGRLALTLAAGMLLGLGIALTQWRGHSGGPAAASDGGGAAAAGGGAGTSATGDALAKLEAQLQQVTQERDAAKEDAAKARAEADKALAEAKAGAVSATAAAQPGTCVDRHMPWQPSAERDKQYPELAEFLKKVGAVWGW